VLAVVLAVFFLIGGVWAYANVDDLRPAASPPDAYLTTAERAATARAAAADARLGRAAAATQQSRGELELARETYRTALDAGRRAARLETAYRTAQRDYAAAQAEEQAARAEAAAAAPAASAAYARSADEADQASRQREVVVFLLRLVLVLVLLAVGYRWFLRLRRSDSRYQPVALAFVAATTLLGLVLAGDYLTDHIDVLQLGPLVISLAGIALTIAVFWWLQRFLARRVPQRRVRRGECPFCGYPVRGGEHCEGCGRTVVGECATCQRPRRVGTYHCAECGAS
jgi:hypothetical protein